VRIRSIARRVTAVRASVDWLIWSDGGECSTLFDPIIGIRR
jgi:hypothetical protein